MAVAGSCAAYPHSSSKARYSQVQLHLPLSHLVLAAEPVPPWLQLIGDTGWGSCDHSRASQKAIFKSLKPEWREEGQFLPADTRGFETWMQCVTCFPLNRGSWFEKKLMLRGRNPGLSCAATPEFQMLCSPPPHYPCPQHTAGSPRNMRSH